MRAPLSARLVLSAALCLPVTAGVVATARAAAAAAAAKCAQVDVRIAPQTVQPGQPVTVSGSVTNCSSRTETVTIRVRVVGPGDRAGAVLPRHLPGHCDRAVGWHGPRPRPGQLYRHLRGWQTLNGVASPSAAASEKARLCRECARSIRP